MIWQILSALALVVGALGLLTYLLTRAEKSGEAKAEAKNSEALIDAVRDHKQIENDVKSLPAGDARKRLHDWSRD